MLTLTAHGHASPSDAPSKEDDGHNCGLSKKDHAELKGFGEED